MPWIPAASIIADVPSRQATTPKLAQSKGDIASADVHLTHLTLAHGCKASEVLRLAIAYRVPFATQNTQQTAKPRATRTRPDRRSPQQLAGQLQQMPGLELTVVKTS